ncbi:MAG TPA: sialate O-acetylesterase [Chitinophagaceae bacterium]
MKQIVRYITLVLLISQSTAHAQVRLPKLISNGMVLQRDCKLKIWGWAAPGEQVSVMFSSNKSRLYTTKANKNGEWSVTLAKQKAGGTYYMKIAASNRLVIEDILVGDVWLCSGQSNMEQGMGARLKYKYAEEIATANNNFIRHFLVPDKYNFNQPETDVENANWKAVTPQNMGEFTAVGYFFAKELYAQYKIPIGLINAALGGSPAEAWISEDALKKFPDYYNEMQKFKDAKLIADIENKDRVAGNAWNKEINDADEGQKQNWKDPSFNSSSWEEMTVPGVWKRNPTGPFNVVVWLRKEINVPASMIGKPAKLELGTITNADSVFVNGVFVGNTTYQYPARRYELKNNVLKEGKNLVVIRVLSSSGNGGFVQQKRYELTAANDTIDLKGNWKYKVGATALKGSPATTTIRFKPGGLYNAMIAPLINYPIKGAIWYQGETNSNYPDNYKSIMQTMIEDWRSKWSVGNFPFLFVQLPNYMEAAPTPQQSSKWAALREQQLQTLTVPNTGMAVAIDLGEWNDLHPENKKDVGYRLSLLARKMAYSEKKLVASGPLYKSMEAAGEKLIIHFSNTGSGLIAKDNEELRHFAVAGADGKYYPAKAIIRNNTVEVWYEGVKNPVYVKYAWADNPEGVNLYNKEGLPASPFEAAIKK